MKMISYLKKHPHVPLIFLLFSFFWLSSIAYSSEIKRTFNPVLSIIGGEEFTNRQQIQKYTVDDEFSYLYLPYHEIPHYLYWGAGIGIQGNLISSESIDETLSIVWYQNKDLYPHGYLIQGINMESSETYPYNYQINIKQFMLEGKIKKKIKPYFNPYFTLGLGRAKIHASHFNVLVPPFYEFTAKFDGNTQNNFSYSLATGLHFDLTNRLALSLGYQFTSLGSIKFGIGTVDGIPTNFRFTQGKLSFNRVIVQFFLKLG